MLAMVANDNVGVLTPRVLRDIFASMLAPTGTRCGGRQDNVGNGPNLPL